MSVTPNSTVRTSIKTQNTKITNRVTQGHNTGAITQKKETINGKTETFDYTYDNMGRFAKSCRVGIPTHQGCEAYTYDDNGNRASATINGTSTTASYTLDDALNVYGDNTYRYDEDGYLKEKVTPSGTSTYSYGTRGELLSVTTTTSTGSVTVISYQHNALNQRVAKLVNGQVVEKYLWADLTTLLAIYDKDDNLKQRFVYADQRMPISITQGNDTYYLHYDQVGSLRAVSDDSHTVVKEITYDTYGSILTDSNEAFKVPFGFAGGLYDTDTKLTRFGYRDYDATTGKWTAKDPIGFNGGDSNLYGYVLGDPVGLVDPSGLVDENLIKTWWKLHDILPNIQSYSYNPENIYTIVAHGQKGTSNAIRENLDVIVQRIKQSGKQSIELLVCESGQHNEGFENFNGENIVEELHRLTGLPIKFSEDKVFISPILGPQLWKSDKAKNHGWKWLR